MSSTHRRSRMRLSRGSVPALLLCLLAACQPGPGEVPVSSPAEIGRIPAGMSEVEVATLASLQQIDDYPLYTMFYQADYLSREAAESPLAQKSGKTAWSCALFTAAGDENQLLFGRNFDWEFSPALMLFTDPSDGYASVSMVDIAFLGFSGSEAYGLMDMPLEERRDLLSAPFLPTDGMNEVGIAVGMAAVPDGGMTADPDKETIDSLLVIRKILDQAATIEEAVEIIQSYNIDPGSGPPLHYLVADKTGRSALVEYSRGEMVVIFNEQPWQAATNFLLSEAGPSPGQHCWRYGVISNRLSQLAGVLTARQALDLLEEVSQPITQWSVVYQISAGKILVAMGGAFEHGYELDFMR